MILLGLMGLTASNALAQETAEQGDDVWANVEEMLVVGSGAAGLLANSGTSVTAFDADALEAIGATDVSDIAAFTPNLEINTTGATSATLFIRGVGLNDFTANGAGAVAVYQDDIALNLPAIQLGQLFDTSDVQVLKGPQGSGPGRNASAGAIRIYSNKPTGEFSAKLRVEYGRFDAIDAEGHLEAPVLADVLSTRFAFRLQRRDGLVKNRCAFLTDAERTQPLACGSSPSQEIPAGLDKYLNNIDTYALRNTTRFVPDWTDLDMSWLLNLHFARIDQLGTVGQVIGASEGLLGGGDAGGYRAPEIQNRRDAILSTLPPFPGVGRCRRNPSLAGCDSGDIANQRLSRELARQPLDDEPFEGDYNLPGYERQSSWGGYLKGEWTIDPVTITSITGYEYYNRERLLDADYGPNTLFEFDIADRAWQTTQELQIGGTLESTPLDWEVGGYALFEELDYEQLTLPGVNPQIFKIDQVYTQETRSFAFYGEFVWEFIDDFELEAGARYNWEQKQIDADVETQSNGICTNNVRDPGVLFCRDQATFDHPTGLLKLKHFLSEDVSVYLKYTHGWKGPQYNIRDGTTTLGVVDVAGPEKIDSFEWGFNGDWFDGRLNVHGALFWYDYQDYQVFVFSNELGVPPQRIVVNADDAQLYGAELETTIEPVDNLIVDVRAGWLESKFLQFTRTSRRQFSTAPGAPLNVISIPIDFNGNRLPNTPRFKVSVSVEYTLELDRFGSLVPRYDMAWTDDVFFDQSEGRGAPSVTGTQLEDFAIGQKAYAIHNLRLTYKAPGGNLELAVWVRNLTDELYKTFAFDASQAVRLTGNLVGDPRTYGLSATASF